MRFCSRCGTYLRKTAEGLWCPKCDELSRSKARLETGEKITKKKDSDAIHVVNKSRYHHAKVPRTCPGCGNKEAFHWYSTISGEHAGIRRERTVEHFKCTKCSYSWSISS